jgi:hypothetical protein
MAYFLTDEQEYELNVFLDEENRNICEQQLESEDVPEELKQIIRSTIDAGSPIPAFNPIHGYYSVSFTPCEEGNRIYVHHHLSNKSKALHDPSKVNDEIEEHFGDVKESIDSEVYEDTNDENIITDILELEEKLYTDPESLTKEEIESLVGPPPVETI